MEDCVCNFYGLWDSIIICWLMVQIANADVSWETPEIEYLIRQDQSLTVALVYLEVLMQWAAVRMNLMLIMAPPHNHCGSSVSSSDLYPTSAIWGYSPDFAFLPPTTVEWKSLQVETFSVKLNSVIVSYVKSKYSRHSLEEGGRRLVSSSLLALIKYRYNFLLLSASRWKTKKSDRFLMFDVEFWVGGTVWIERVNF